VAASLSASEAGFGLAAAWPFGKDSACEAFSSVSCRFTGNTLTAASFAPSPETKFKDEIRDEHSMQGGGMSSGKWRFSHTHQNPLQEMTLKSKNGERWEEGWGKGGQLNVDPSVQRCTCYLQPPRLEHVTTSFGTSHSCKFSPSTKPAVFMDKCVHTGGEGWGGDTACDQICAIKSGTEVT